MNLHRSDLNQPKTSQNRQSGMVLLLCLIFMTALTLLGLSASSDTILQKQLARNLHNTEYAKQTAYLSLQWAEQWVSELPASAMASCDQACSGFYTHTAGSLDDDLQFLPVGYWRMQGFEVGLDPATGARLVAIGLTSVEPPIWIIENLHHSAAVTDHITPENNTPARDWFRILVRSSGRSANTVSVIESVIVRTSGDSNQTPPPLPQTERVSWRELR